MNRRGFFSALAVTPLMPLVAEVPWYRRIKWHPGHWVRIERAPGSIYSGWIQTVPTTVKRR
jgi:hypothetical protein